MKEKFFFDRVVAVTGAANGIGKALSLKLAREGAIVWALDFNQTALATLNEEAKKFHLSLFTEKVDVTDSLAVADVISKIVKNSQVLDMWVNNAGISGVGGFLAQSPQEFSKVVSLNLEAVIHSTRAVLTLMENQGTGTLVNMASIAGHLSAPYMSAYCTTKHAVVGFTRAIREELRMQDSPIKVVLASPGFVDTSMIARGEKLGFPEWLRWALSTPEKVAQEILSGVQAGEEEIFPTQNGKWMLRAFRFFPKSTLRSSKMLLTRSFKDLLLNRYKVD